MARQASQTRLFAAQALLPSGWADNVAVTIDGSGTIADVAPDTPRPPEQAELLAGALVPGMPNAHSHAFQRALVGMAERRTSGSDDFWSWRRSMYRLAAAVTPEHLEAIATQLYVELLRHGYTSVAEFQYLHHDIDGRPFADPAEMSHRLVAAARAAGIGITLLPVLYCYSDFNRAPPRPEQQRFVMGVDDYARLVEGLWHHYRDDTAIRLGVAPHSPHAVGEAELGAALQLRDTLGAGTTLHIHVAEQEREVSSSLQHHGLRPVEWLLDRFGPDQRWCLVHATHLDGDEGTSLAATGAVVGLCPTTEANLGDGIFPAADFLAAGGRIAIGSDSQVDVSPAAELRLLEYGQRLLSRQRTRLASEAQPSVGQNLFLEAARGGASALGIEAGSIAQGARADLLVLDLQLPVMYGKYHSDLLDSWVLSGHGNPVSDVMVGGRWQVRAGVHLHEERSVRAFRGAMDKLLEIH